MTLEAPLNSLGLRSHSPPLRARPRVTNPPAAQLCPEDILRIIYYGASRPDAARGALVCRSWHEACMAELYRAFRYTQIQIHFYWGSYRSKWIDHLRNSRALRTHVRSLFIDMALRPPTRPMSSILTPLTPLFTPKSTGSLSPSYLRLDDCWHIGQAPHMIAKSHMIRHVLHLSLRYSFSPTYPGSHSNYNAALRIILPAASSIVSFSAKLVTWPISILSQGNTTPLGCVPLRRLSICIDDLGWEVLPLLVAVKDTLQRFHLLLDTKFNKGVHPQGWNACIAAISNMHNLTELMIDFGFYYPPIFPPILDEIVPCLPNLCHLFCGIGTFTTALHLPVTLEVLHLVGYLPDSRDDSPYPKARIASSYNTMRQLLNKTNETRLKCLYWWIEGARITAELPVAVEELEAKAREVNVDFHGDWNWNRRKDLMDMAPLEPWFSLESIMPRM